MCLRSVNLMVTYQSRWTSRLVRFRKSAERRVPVGDVIEKCRSSEGFPRASSSSYMILYDGDYDADGSKLYFWWWAFGTIIWKRAALDVKVGEVQHLGHHISQEASHRLQGSIWIAPETYQTFWNYLEHELELCLWRTQRKMLFLFQEWLKVTVFNAS